MQSPPDKQHVRARLRPTAVSGRFSSGLWLEGHYFERHPQLGGEPGYSLVVGRMNGRPFTGPYYADRVVEWCVLSAVEGQTDVDAILAADTDKADVGQMSLFSKPA